MENRISLNRTFYGIETRQHNHQHNQHNVLIVPFMELKLTNQPLEDTTEASLNRTFYGIETYVGILIIFAVFVLIVPFMELKRIRKARTSKCR